MHKDASESERMAYARILCRSLKCQPNTVLNMRDKRVLRWVAVGIVIAENSRNPYNEELLGRVFR